MKLSSIDAVARSLLDARVPFLVVGGLAVVAHGYGRQTQDLDLVVPLDEPTLSAAFGALALCGYRPRVPVTAAMLANPEQRRALHAGKGMVVLAFDSDQHPETPVDLFAHMPFDFAGEHAAALQAEVAPGVPVRVVRLQTLLAMKRAAARPQDLADVHELERIHGGGGA
jgi:predicted nucleotidyltransferase